MLDSYSQLAIASATGILFHYGYFIHGEIDLQAANIARFYLFGTISVAVLKSYVEGSSGWVAFKASCFLTTIHVVFLMGSIAFYRLFLSPIRHIKGPLSLRLSKIPHIYGTAVAPNCRILHKLHEEYGDVVRTGPNEVTLYGTDAFYKIHGPDSACEKGQYYDILHPMGSIVTVRDIEVFNHKRRIWDKSFSIRSLKNLEPMVYEEATKLVEQLEKRQDKPLDISEWLEFYTWDLMGRFGLTINFDNLGAGKAHPILILYHLAHEKLGPLGVAPWSRHLMMGIPYIKHMKHYRQFMVWAEAELDRNINSLSKDRVDVIGHVIEDAKKQGGIQKNWNYILGDFVAVMAAGSDPMRQILANLVYYLIKNPEHVPKLRKELDATDLDNYTQVQTLAHLNACIYETLRLNPPVASAGLRLIPKGGMEINGVFIPGGTTVCVPQYSLFRDKRNFADPLAWIPERFTTKQDLVLDKQAFAPWSAGRYLCVGKNLSLMEIRIAAVKLVTTFDFRFAAGEDGSRMFADALDYFTTTPGRMDVIITARKKNE